MSMEAGHSPGEMNPSGVMGQANFLLSLVTAEHK